MKGVLTGLALLSIIGAADQVIAEENSKPSFGVTVEGEARYKLSKARDWEDGDLPDFIDHPFPAAAGPRVTLHYGPFRASGFFGDTKTAKDLFPTLNLGARFHETRTNNGKFNLFEENSFSWQGTLEAQGNWQVFDDAKSITFGFEKDIKLGRRFNLKLDSELDFFAYEMRASADGRLTGNANWQLNLGGRTIEGILNGEQPFYAHLDIASKGVNFNFTPTLIYRSPIGNFSAGPILSERNIWTGYDLNIQGQELEAPRNLQLGKYETQLRVGGDFKYENHGFGIGLKVNTGYGDAATIGYTRKFGGSKPKTKPVKITKQFLRKVA